jgi:O-antigen/teichoic acid export membrane protein
LNISLIPVFGLVGAALATLLTDIVINLFFDFIVKRNRWIFFLKLEALFFIKVGFS